MASDLTPISIAAPGFFGLNTQDSPIGLPPEYALEAKNCVIDRLGRVGARKGWESFSAITGAITLVHEFIDADGTVRYLAISGGAIWEVESDGTATSIYTGTWSNASTLAGDMGWKAVTFNGYAWFFKRGEDPLRYAPGTYSPYTTGGVAKVTAVAGYTATVPQANEVLSAYGRLWVADTSTDKVTIKWSDTLIGQAWSGGASGSLSLETVLTNGTRPVVALAAFNGFLVIFCDTCIVIYDGAAEDPSTNIVLVEVIDGVGCISRDSVQDTGSDILFLSATGVRSLGRIINEKSAPIYDVSRNVRDDLIETISLNDDDEYVKSCYNDLEGFYVITFINEAKTFVLDLKNRLENNVCRVTTWTLNPYAYCLTKDKQMLMGFSGNIGVYSGYKDNLLPYRFNYTTSWLSGEQQVALKILKSVRMITVEGAGYTLTLSWGFDYAGRPYSTQKAIGSVSGLSEWNIAEWGVGEFGNMSYVNTIRAPLAGTGQVFQFDLSTSINGQPLSLQQLDIFTKIGRLA